jgi:hypothetical protein
MSKSTSTSVSCIPFDPQRPYSLTEDQHYSLYQARHLAELFHGLCSGRDEFVNLRHESVAVVFNLIGDLLDTAVPNLVFKPKGEKS